MSNNPAEFKTTGLKATLPRLKILEIFRLLLSENLEIGLATVYRVLTQFEQAGILSRNYFETGKAVFELNEGSHHDHIVCLDCGRVEEFQDDEIEKRQHEIADKHGFEIVDHTLAIYGHCVKPDCKHKK